MANVLKKDRFMKQLFSSANPLWPGEALGLVRIIVGLFMVYHGWEVFDSAKMADYAGWDIFQKYPSAKVAVYIGKSAELISGILLTIGLFVRLASLLLGITMLYISLFVGKGVVWYGDQHPFLFV
jgi:uncharacterized membrane protein YphA (DoxX/SURF4 family)